MRIPFLLLIFVLFSVSVAHAQTVGSSQNDIPVRFAIMQLSPYGIIDDDGTASGYLYETGNLILEKAGFPIINNVLPLKRLGKEMFSGNRDCAIAGDTHYVKEKYQLVEKIGLNLEIGVMPRLNHPLNKYEDLYSTSVAVPRGASLSKRFDSDTNILKIITRGYSNSVQMLLKGRVDAVAGAIDSIRYNIKQENLDPDDIIGSPLVFLELELWLVCVPDRLPPSIIDRLREAIVTLRESGQIQKIINRY